MIHDPGYLCRLEELRWFPWTVDAVRLLKRAGFLVFVTTNQGGVGLGLYEEGFVHAVHEAMSAHVAAGGGRIDGWFCCSASSARGDRRTAPHLRLSKTAARPRASGAGAVRSRPGALVRRRRQAIGRRAGVQRRRAGRARPHRPGRIRGCRASRTTAASPHGSRPTSWKRRPGSWPGAATRARPTDGRRRDRSLPSDPVPFPPGPRRRRRRSHRRRVHLRASRARLARSAGAHPRLRLDRDRAGRRGERREQRRGARRGRRRDWHRRAGSRRDAGCSTPCRRAPGRATCAARAATSRR